jgi:hypothetical protein
LAFLYCLVGNLEERVLSGTVHILTPNILSETSQHSDAPEQNLGDVAMDATETETEDTRVEEASDISPNVQNDDPLSRFLPPAVTTKCSAALQVIFPPNKHFRTILSIFLM